MARLPVPRHVRLVAAVELRRSWRRLTRESPYLWLKALVGVTFLLGYAAVAGASGFFLAVVASEGVPAGAPLDAIEGARTIVAGLLAMVAFFAVQRTVKGKGVPDAAPGLLTTTSHRNLATGLLVAETARIVTVAAVPLFALAGGVAAGFEDPLAFPFVAGSLLGILVVGVAVGFVGGLAVKNVAVRSRTVARHRLAANLLTTIVLLGSYLVLLRDPGSFERVAGVFQANPMGWPADLALARGPVTVDGFHAVVGGIGLVAVPAVSVLGATVLARWLWYTDGASPEQSDGPASEKGPTARLRSMALSPVGSAASHLPRPVRAVAAKSLRRVSRAPHTAQYAILPLFFLFYEAQAVAVSGAVPARLPAILGVAGAWATGAVFTLNPIGNEEPVLPVTLTTAVPGRAFLAGLSVAELAVFAPLTMVVAGVTAGIARLDPLATALVLGGTASVCAVAPGLAAAAGVRFPKRDATAVGRGREVVLPSPWAFAAFSVALVAVGGPMIVAFTGGGAELAGQIGATTLEIRAIGVGVTALFAAIVGSLAYRDAARQISAYRLD